MVISTSFSLDSNPSSVKNWARAFLITSVLIVLMNSFLCFQKAAFLDVINAQICDETNLLMIVWDTNVHIRETLYA